jgi:hypothetical protein
MLPHKPTPRVDLSSDHECSHQIGSSTELGRSGQGRLPKLQFLIFNDEDPQLWRSHCENYFDMYGVESNLWVRVSSMHFEDTMAHWLQSVECRVKYAGWVEFRVMIHDHFG